MDKVVYHLLVFKGDGVVKDFPGNYTQYREWSSLQTKEEQAQKAALNSKREIEKKTRNNTTRTKKTYKEKIEFEQLEKDIAALEAEQKRIENALCGGPISVEEITEMSKRLPIIKDEIDEKSMRWLELSELD